MLAWVIFLHLKDVRLSKQDISAPTPLTFKAPETQNFAEEHFNKSPRRAMPLHCTSRLFRDGASREQHSGEPVRASPGGPVALALVFYVNFPPERGWVLSRRKTARNRRQLGCNISGEEVWHHHPWRFSSTSLVTTFNFNVNVKWCHISVENVPVTSLTAIQFNLIQFKALYLSPRGNQNTEGQTRHQTQH